MEIGDLRKEAGRLEKSVALKEEEEKRNEPKIASYDSENNLLRKKILSLRKVSNER